MLYMLYTFLERRCEALLSRVNPLSGPCQGSSVSRSSTKVKSRYMETDNRFWTRNANDSRGYSLYDSNDVTR